MVAVGLNPRHCGLCGSALAQHFADVPILDSERVRDVHECRACHSRWTRLVDGVGSGTYYEAKPLEDHNVLDRWPGRYHRLRRTVERAVGTTTFSILDVGCASGGHLAAYPLTVTKVGVEPASSAGDLLRSRGIQWFRTVSDLPAGAMFDAITCMDVIEHLEDPASLLAGMTTLLRPGGVLVLVTGDIDSFGARFSGRRWLYHALPEHCSFFSARSLQTHLSGLTLEYRSRIAEEDLRPRYVARFARGVMLETVNKLLPGRATRLEREGRAFFPHFYDNMLLVFRAQL